MDGIRNDSYERPFKEPQSSCDLIVIGGGINGAAIARDASMRGLSVTLLEKRDFGAGASTKTSKLVHGGLRYLENRDFALVKESLYEQALLLRNAPHIVHPLTFLFPVYAHTPRPLWQVHLGLYIYDFFSRHNGMPGHRKCSKKEVVDHYPQMNQKDLLGGCEYHDAQMLDNRLVIENILAAESAGAVVLNYAEVFKLLRTKDRIDGIYFRNVLTGQEGSISCKAIVNATGAWSNQITAMDSSASHLRVTPTKGTHLVIPQVYKSEALILHAPQDGRIFFILPWGNHSLLGTTDTFYNKDPNDVSVEDSDIAYLLEAFNFYFPQLQLTKSSIIASFAGLRPLVSNDSNSISPSGISRSHAIHRSETGLITILGGKFTTHRKIAQDVVDAVLTELGTTVKCHPCATMLTPLPGAWHHHTQEDVRLKLRSAGLKNEQVNHLMSNYGELSLRILKIIQSDSREAVPICPEHPHIFAELTYAISVEHAKRLDDWFCRRTSIAYDSGCERKCLSKVAARFAALLGWNQSQMEQAISLYTSKQS